jgi:hypothetical protein
MVNKLWFLVLASATALAMSPAAKADSFDVTLSSTAGPGLTASGTLSGSSLGGGAFSITGGNMTIDGMTATVIGNPYSSAVAFDDLSTGGTISLTMPSFKDDWFSFDDVLIPGTTPYVNGNGLLFLLSNGGVVEFYDYDGALSWNEFVDGAWVIDSSLPNVEAGGQVVSANISTAPEASSSLLFGTGLLLLAGFLFWKARPGMVRAK